MEADWSQILRRLICSLLAAAGLAAAAGPVGAEVNTPPLVTPDIPRRLPPAGILRRCA